MSHHKSKTPTTHKAIYFTYNKPKTFIFVTTPNAKWKMQNTILLPPKLKLLFGEIPIKSRHETDNKSIYLDQLLNYVQVKNERELPKLQVVLE